VQSSTQVKTYQSFFGAQTMQTEKIHAIIEREITEKFESIVSDFELFGESVEPVECKSRDGFFAFTNGGTSASGMSTLDHMQGSGSFPDSCADTLQSIIESNNNQALESFKDDNKNELKELFKKDIDDIEFDYHSLYEMNQADLAENLSEYESNYLQNETVLFKLGVFYYGPDNYKNDYPGKHTVYIHGFINWESPYHRSPSQIRKDVGRSCGTIEWNAENSQTVSFKTYKELKQKLAEILPKIVKEF